MSDWRPSASLEMIRLRAEVYAKIRTFFAERDVLEVETPALSQAAVSDPYLIPMQTQVNLPGHPPQTLYLHISPEYPMKRLLAAGSGSIYQLCKVFRNDECGRLHNPEFTMLEWYRVGFDEFQLMDEIEQLYQLLVKVEDPPRISRTSYAELFLTYLEVDPHAANLEDLLPLVHQYVDPMLQLDDKEACLEVLISHVIEPQLQAPTFIFDFPASMAALAQKHLNAQGVEVARRFELYARGIELANGYFELQDAKEQRLRFSQDQQRREETGRSGLPYDQRLLDALEYGLPSCAGVALGIDRLLMVCHELASISSVQAFSTDRA